MPNIQALEYEKSSYEESYKVKGTEEITWASYTAYVNMLFSGSENIITGLCKQFLKDFKKNLDVYLKIIGENKRSFSSHNAKLAKEIFSMIEKIEAKINKAELIDDLNRFILYLIKSKSSQPWYQRKSYLYTLIEKSVINYSALTPIFNEARIKLLKNKNKEQEDKIKEQENKNKEQEDKVADLSRQWDETKKLLIKREQEIVDLCSKEKIAQMEPVEEINKKKLSIENEEQTNEIDKLKRGLDEARNSLSEKERELAEIKKQKEEAESKLLSMQEIQKTNQRKILSYPYPSPEIIKKMEKLEEIKPFVRRKRGKVIERNPKENNDYSIKCYQRDNEELASEIKLLREKNIAQKEFAEKSNKHLDQLKQELKQEKEIRETLARDNERLKKENEDRENAMAKKLMERDNEISRLKESLQKVQSENSNLNAGLSKIKSKFSKLKKFIENLQKKYGIQIDFIVDEETGKVRGEKIENNSDKGTNNNGFRKKISTVWPGNRTSQKNEQIQPLQTEAIPAAADSSNVPDNERVETTVKEEKIEEEGGDKKPNNTKSRFNFEFWGRKKSQKIEQSQSLQKNTLPNDSSAASEAKEQLTLSN